MKTVKFRRGRRVKCETKKFVCNVFAYFDRQEKKARVSSSPLICTVKAAGLSQTTVTQIKREQRPLPEGVESRDTVSAFCRTSLFIAQKCPLVSDVTMSCEWAYSLS